MKILDTLVSEVLARSPRLQQLNSVVNDLAVEMKHVKEAVVTLAEEYKKIQLVLYHHAEALRQLNQFNGQIAKNIQENSVDLRLGSTSKNGEDKPN